MKRLNVVFISLFFSLGLCSFVYADSIINGAGATFPYPLYTKWFAEYNKLNAEIKINYQSIGSGGGIRLLLDRKIDFAASDIPMSDKQLAQAPAPILHIPSALGAVVLTYNLPGVDQALKLNATLIADIFLGKISKWNDKRILELNPALKVADSLNITVVHRSDGSGTSAIFTAYLAKLSLDWEKRVGAGTAVDWPAGLGGKGNEGVAGAIKQNPGSIGYVELIYAANNKIPYASIQNKAGEFVLPTNSTIKAAMLGVQIPDDFRASILDPEGKEAYPICGLTYILVYQKMPAPKGAQFISFLHWSLAEGQKYLEPLTYTSLPPAFLQKVGDKIKSLQAVVQAAH